jgi:acyl-CoA thioesterase I
MLITLLLIVVVLLLVTVVRLLSLRNDVAGYKQYWQNQREVPDAKLTYIALGDSAAQGIGASKPQKGYVGLVANWLAEKHGTSVKTINLSATGAKVQDVIDNQLPILKQLQPSSDTVVTIDIGANNLGQYDEETFKSQLDTLYSQLPKQTVVADMPYFGGGRFRPREANAESASAIVREVAGRYGLRVAPLHQITKERDNLLTYGADLFHPNDRGYRNWFEAFKQSLQQ